MNTNEIDIGIGDLIDGLRSGEIAPLAGDVATGLDLLDSLRSAGADRVRFTAVGRDARVVGARVRGRWIVLPPAVRTPGF